MLMPRSPSIRSAVSPSSVGNIRSPQPHLKGAVAPWFGQDPPPGSRVSRDSSVSFPLALLHREAGDLRGSRRTLVEVRSPANSPSPAIRASIAWRAGDSYGVPSSSCSHCSASGWRRSSEVEPEHPGIGTEHACPAGSSRLRVRRRVFHPNHPRPPVGQVRDGSLIRS